MEIRKDPEDRADPSLICQFTLRLGGYSIWSVSTSSTIYKRKNLGLEHLIASMQPRKYSEDYSKYLEDYPKHSMDSKGGQQAPKAFKALVALVMGFRGSRSTRRTSSEAPDAYRTRLRRARRLVRPGAAGLLMGVEYSRVGSTAWVCPTSTVTTRTAVELA